MHQLMTAGKTHTLFNCWLALRCLPHKKAWTLAGEEMLAKGVHQVLSLIKLWVHLRASLVGRRQAVNVC